MNNIKDHLKTDAELKEQIIQLYIKENHTKAEVAQDLHLTTWTLSNLLKIFDIKKDQAAVVYKRKQTSLQKYGVENPAQAAEIKSKIGAKNRENKVTRAAKMRQTKLLRYGNANYNNMEQNAQTKLEHFGDMHYNNRDKYRNTMLERYGIDNGFKSRKLIESNLKKLLDTKNYSETFKEIFLDREKAVEFLSGGTYSYFDLTRIFNASYYIIQTWATRLDLKDYIKFTFDGRSHYEDDIYEFLKSLHVGDIRKNYAELPKQQEIDLYIPTHKLGIEFNGDYWHSAEYKGKEYHYKKSYVCEQQGIRLIHIYEHQWRDAIKQEILKSIIRNALGLNENIIYARNCTLKELKCSDVLDFSERNSLHGHRNASIYLGLFYNDELVEIMTFGKAFFSRDSSIDYECIRSITKINTTVIGGMNKLFKYFIRNWQPNKILYYVDYNTHVGNSMTKLGFKFIDYSKGGIINVSTCAETLEKYGPVFNRKPQKHKEIQAYVDAGKILTIHDAGVKKYVWAAPECNNLT